MNEKLIHTVRFDGIIFRLVRVSRAGYSLRTYDYRQGPNMPRSTNVPIQGRVKAVAALRLVVSHASLRLK